MKVLSSPPFLKIWYEVQPSSAERRGGSTLCTGRVGLVFRWIQRQRSKDKDSWWTVSDANLQVFFGLRLAILLRYSDNFSALLQAKDLCVMEVQKISKKTVKTIKKMKCGEKELRLFWKDIQNKAPNLHIDSPKLPRKRTATPRIEECKEEMLHQSLTKTLFLTTEEFIYWSSGLYN